MEDLDKMLDALNLPQDLDSYDCILTLHSDFKKILEDANKGIIKNPNEIKRYRGFLLWFDNRIEKKLFFVGFIDNEIESLRYLQSLGNRWFSQEEYDKLNYLLSSKQKADT
jgi:hypothetical protein